MCAMGSRTKKSGAKRSDHCSNERGAALVELAVVLPVLAVLLVGTIDFGRVFRDAMIVTNAARAGALYGGQSIPKSADTAGMISAADAVLSANNLGTGPASQASRSCVCADNSGNFTPTSPANTCSATCAGGHVVVTVTVTATRTFSMINPFPGLPSTVTVARSATQRVQ